MGLDIYQTVVCGWRLHERVHPTFKTSCCHEAKQGHLFCPVCGTAVRESIRVPGMPLDEIVRDPLVTYRESWKGKKVILGIKLWRSESHRCSPIRAVCLSKYLKNPSDIKQRVIQEVKEYPQIMAMLVGPNIKDPEFFSVLDISS